MNKTSDCLGKLDDQLSAKAEAKTKGSLFRPLSPAVFKAKADTKDETDGFLGL